MAEEVKETVEIPQAAQAEATEQKDRSQEAEKILQEEFEKKREQCWREIGAALQKYHMTISVDTILRGDGRIMHQLNLVRAPQQHSQ